MPTIFFSFTASSIVCSRVKFLPIDNGHVFLFAMRRLAIPQKTQRWGLVMKSSGSQLMVKASKFRFLYVFFLRPGVSLGSLLSARTRMIEINECEYSGLFLAS